MFLSYPPRHSAISAKRSSILLELFLRSSHFGFRWVSLRVQDETPPVLA